MRRRVIVTFNNGSGYHLRGWQVAVIFLLLIVGLGYLFARPFLAARPNVFTVTDLNRLETEAQERPGDVEAQINAVFAFAALLSQIGDIEQAASSTLALGEDDPWLKDNPKILESKEKLRQELAKIRAKVEIHSEQEFLGLLDRGLALGEATLARQDLDNSQRAAVHLARGRLLLQAQRPQDALTEAEAARKLGSDPVMTQFLMADAKTDLRRYSEAVDHLRKASVALSSWANKEPGWEVRLAWAMARPGTRWRYEKRWRERRRELASDLRSVIAADVQVLQGLQRLEQLSRREQAR